jgi:type IV pilus assembly protein PilW
MAVMAGNASASAASATCTLIEVNDTSAPDGFTIGHTTAAFTSYYAASGAAAASAPFNAASGTGAVYSSGTLFNLGPQPRRNTWAIANGRVLQRTDAIFGTAPFDVAEGVINLKAEYGYDTDGNRQIAATEWTTTPPLDWTRVLAIRVAVLVRSSQFEQSADTGASAAGGAVTASAPTWGNGNTFLMTNVDGSNDSYDPTQAVANNWRYYRYRVYEKVIPLRNMIWG